MTDESNDTDNSGVDEKADHEDEQTQYGGTEDKELVGAEGNEEEDANE